MRYLCLIHAAEERRPVPGTPEFNALVAANVAASHAMASAGVLLDAAPLHPAHAATTLRVRDGELSLADGPAARLPEPLAGYYLLDCADLDEALRWARTIPAASTGTVEVRPVGPARTALTFDLYLRATPDAVWQALTDPAIVPRWRFGLTFDTDWQAGSPLTTKSPDGTGTVLESVAGQRLRYDWTQADHPEDNGGHPSVVSFELTPMGEVTRLAVSHRDLATDGAFVRVVRPGWPMILSGLKSLVETGEPLPF
jgi:uncharacterized protein YndB with AHSA1/START domain